MYYIYMNKQIVDFLEELVKFRTREVGDMLKVGYARDSIPTYQERTKELQSLIDSLKQTKSENECKIERLLTIDEAIEHATEVGNRDDSACCQQHMQLANWLKELKELKQTHKYLAADFDNYKKRVLNEKDTIAFETKSKMLIDILRCVDDMERLLRSCKENMSKVNLNNPDRVSVKEVKSESARDHEYTGFKLIYENLIKLLESKGCKKIECTYGDKYDWKWHEAISTRKIADDEGYDSGDIVEIYQTGWTVDGKLLRPTKVIVGE